jgi:hypothetical protein
VIAVADRTWLYRVTSYDRDGRQVASVAVPAGKPGALDQAHDVAMQHRDAVYAATSGPFRIEESS